MKFTSAVLHSRRQRHEGNRIREDSKALRGGEALKGEPQERSGMKQVREVPEEGNRQEG
jgi:hypothetical protein